MKTAIDFRRDSTRLYDLTKEYHELQNALLDEERIYMVSLPKNDQLFDEGRDTQLRFYMAQHVHEAMPDQLARMREVLAEIDALKNEQTAVIAAGWVAGIEVRERINA